MPAFDRAAWIWTAEPLPARNRFVRFRRTFDHAGGPASLRITADSRYVLWVNGEYVGFGPVRAWPSHWRYDTYDIAPLLRAGSNTIAVLVQHFGEGTFQYLHAPEGLLVDLEIAGANLLSDASWKASPEPACRSNVPRISIQEAFEEQYDARLADGWQAADYDDAAWPAAVAARMHPDGVHADLGPRAIPFLTREPVLPKRLVSLEAVRSRPYRFTIYAKPYLAPDDLTSNMVYAHAYLATQVYAPAACEIGFHIPHKHPGRIKVNGEEARGPAALRAGWNSLVTDLRRGYHLPEFCLVIDGPPGLRFAVGGEAGGAAWALAGPFGLSERDQRRVDGDKDESLIAAQPLVPEATLEAGEAFWASGDVAAAVGRPWLQPVRPEHLPPDDAFVQAYTDEVVDSVVRVDNPDALLSGADWATFDPAEDGADVRLLLDFGAEVVGFHRFEIEAPAGTVLDSHNFEFIQPDGRYNLAEGMNNSFRYVCGDGRRRYECTVRRGFQYSYLILRNLTGPVKLRGVEVLFSSYPPSNRGHFACSDAQLDRIWQVGARSWRCCAEDTYTDCPTYEQTHWVGDARNEALIDWAVNGDPRLWHRCLEQVAHSLERSPITESHVPSAWRNLLPAWSFLWMRSCREYHLFSGDEAGAAALLPWIERNVEGIKQHLDADGLFSIRAWNMFDWAPMDTPNQGVVTHQNCLAAHALRDAAELAERLNQNGLAAEWRALAEALSSAINARLWNDGQQAYTDCLHGAEQSTVYSQQTQTAAYTSGVAQGERRARCRDIMDTPPEGFVEAGSPFFEFFLLEAYQQEGKDREFLDTIRDDWGFMVDMGATTFWEMWSGRGGRLTRSHCHGWSAAPTFFLSTYVLGVQPAAPGFARAVVAPHPGELAWCRGRLPTPRGEIEVQWENEPGRPFQLRITAPAGIELEVTPPREAEVTVNGERRG